MIPFLLLGSRHKYEPTRAFHVPCFICIHYIKKNVNTKSQRFRCFYILFFRSKLPSVLWEFLPGVWGRWTHNSDQHYSEDSHYSCARNNLLLRSRPQQRIFFHETLYHRWDLTGKIYSIFIRCYITVQVRSIAVFIVVLVIYVGFHVHATLNNTHWHVDRQFSILQVHRGLGKLEVLKISE